MCARALSLVFGEGSLGNGLLRHQLHCRVFERGEEFLLERIELIDGNDGIHRCAELALGVEVAELLQIQAQILLRQFGVVNCDPGILQCPFRGEPVVRVHREEGRNQFLGFGGHGAPVLLVKFVFSLSNLPKEISLSALYERRVPSQQNVKNYTWNNE